MNKALENPHVASKELLSHVLILRELGDEETFGLADSQPYASLPMVVVRDRRRATRFK